MDYPVSKMVQTIGDNKCDRVPNLPRATCCYPPLMVNDNRLIACIGWQRICWKLVNGRRWQHHSNLMEERSFSSTISLKSGSYIFGGWQSPTSVEFLPHGSSTWTTLSTNIPKLNSCRPFCSCITGTGIGTGTGTG